MEFICNCGKVFKSAKSLNSHARFCDQYVKKDKRSKYFNYDSSTYICECGYETKTYQALNGHLSHCDIHHQTLGTIRKLRPTEIAKSLCWENKTKDELNEIRKKAWKTRKEKSQYDFNGKMINNWYGMHHTEKTKQHIRESTINYIKETVGDCKARYSKKGCEYINKLNEEKHWNLQHAENGGEVEIAGYFIDGYDNIRNIVFEYDEPYHYKDIENNILKDKDIERQNYIIEKLHCEFWRYNEKKKLLYKVN